MRQERGHGSFGVQPKPSNPADCEADMMGCPTSDSLLGAARMEKKTPAWRKKIKIVCYINDERSRLIVCLLFIYGHRYIFWCFAIEEPLPFYTVIILRLVLLIG